MVRSRRRTVLTLATALALAAPVPAAAADTARAGADTVLLNGFVYTADARDTVARAVAIEDGAIVYVGTDRGARRHIGRGTEVIDLRGRMVMPGIHEGHIHDVIAPDPGTKTCDLKAESLTVPEFQDRVRACLDDPEQGGEGDWLFVDNLYMQFMRPYGTAPHKDMLDALDTDRPIFVSAAVTAHTTLVNQNALDLAGVTRDTPDPDGGRIGHDPAGELNGLLEDNAADLMFAVMPEPPPVPPERRVELAAQRMREFSREGITTFFVPGTSAGAVRTFQALRDAGGLTARAHFALSAGTTELRSPGDLYERVRQTRAELERPEQLPVSVRSWRPGRQTGPWLVPEPGVSVDGVKIYLDGIVQYPGQTAALLEPYLDKDGEPRTDAWARGALWTDGPTLDPVVAELERMGFQSHVHAIGDRAVRTALDAFEHARAENPRIRAHQTIAHAELVDPADFGRFGKLDVTASMGLLWAKPGPDSTLGTKPYLGERFQDRYEPTVPITERGGRVSLGSDCCLEPLDEFFNLEVAVLREGDWGPELPEFAGKVNALPGLSVREAIRAVTINAAYQLHQEKVTGSLERGKLADLIVLDRNLTTIDPDAISDTGVLLTLVGGKKVWASPEL